jgi:hypothetical protein
MATGSKCPPGCKPFDRPLLIQTGTNSSSRPDCHPNSNIYICIGDTLLKVQKEPIAKDSRGLVKASVFWTLEPLPCPRFAQG